jgi:predicted O-methyltransferase YrrM
MRFSKEKIRMILRFRVALGLILLFFVATLGGSAFSAQSQEDLDQKVQDFLDRHRGQWRDMNISESDGKYLYELIIQNRYTRALEIGTSTGHSGIWIAWALSKTGGKLVTIEIDEGRYEVALENFKEAGLSPYIDARLADAHQLVPVLPGPFDFVFCDADKDWYKNYLIAVLPKLEVNGCFVAHNVSERQRGHGWGTGEFLDYIESLPDMKTTFGPPSWTSMSISYKRAAQ